jgi:DNA-binding LytR/AlgR family response regulator
MMKLRTLIVEDEIIWQKLLLSILQNHCSSWVEVVDVTASVEQSIASIQKNKPQLVFLDIKLGENEDGAFHVLKNLEQIDFKIVFTSVYETPTKILTAFNKFSAFKYLVKPLKADGVIDAVKCVLVEHPSQKLQVDINSIKSLLDEYTRNDTPARLQIPRRNGFQYLPFDTIVMLRSDGNSTIIFPFEQEAIVSHKNLKYFESVLPANKFIRVSRSFIIHIDHVDRYSIEDGGTIFLSGDCSAPLSDSSKNRFFEALSA